MRPKTRDFVCHTKQLQSFPYQSLFQNVSMLVLILKATKKDQSKHIFCHGFKNLLMYSVWEGRCLLLKTIGFAGALVPSGSTIPTSGELLFFSSRHKQTYLQTDQVAAQAPELKVLYHFQVRHPSLANALLFRYLLKMSSIHFFMLAQFVCD